MTRAEAYSSGWHEGRRWAEREIRNGWREGDPRNQEGAWSTETARAHSLGFSRGHRDTWARFEAGTLTWEMFENAPMRGDAR